MFNWRVVRKRVGLTPANAIAIIGAAVCMSVLGISLDGVFQRGLKGSAYDLFFLLLAVGSSYHIWRSILLFLDRVAGLALASISPQQEASGHYKADDAYKPDAPSK